MLESVAAFLQQCREWKVTVLDLPTAFWHELTDKLVSERLKLPEELRLIIIGGERAIPQRVAQWHEVVDHRVRLLNTYGPTESTVVASFAELNGARRAQPSMKEVAIGCPMPNVQAYVLDRFLNPTPIGVPGELHLGGAGLARGYFGRPELTAEKFIPHPFNGVRGARLYKTGDLARYLPDGSLEFSGRVDHQVKLRGYRIELGEIESTLMHHPAVQQAVVVLREDSPGDKRIVAYLVSHPDSAPSAQELRRCLQQKLPDYMIPSAFVFLASLPQTRSGKIDRGALPAPDQTRSELERGYAAPSTPFEEVLAKIWSEVLRLERVGVHDNFFDLGGHSLLATKTIAHASREFGRDIPLRYLFENPTVAELASAIMGNELQEETMGEISMILADIESLSEEEARRHLEK
jgi:acyl-coenzyme A synthetase/AMP-(fatty) acid ligase